MHKLTLKTEIVSVFLINLREGWQVVVALLVQVYDTVLVDFTELPSIIDAVAKSIEAFLVPAELLDLGCCLSLFVEEALQLNQPTKYLTLPNASYEEGERLLLSII